ncbi:MAG: cytochrome C oxidase subunit II [Nitrospinae bacterium]|nr:cytochrome C oxidase subunit II [Nitrospinota bacterium]
MSIYAVKPGWWNTPVHREEKIWIGVALVWCIAITLIMPVWHVVGDQNSSQEYYRISGDNYAALTDAFIEQYKVGEVQGIAVVAPPPGSDIFLRGAQWQWDPILKLTQGATYRLHLGSVDMVHAISIFPININFEVVPGYDYVLTITPTSAGEFRVICNEFCGIGHHGMIGKLIVDPA